MLGVSRMSEGRLDWVAQQEHPANVCKDCEVGEPHMCPRLREHVPADAMTICGYTGLVYCKRCGLLLAASDRPDLDPDRKPCRQLYVELGSD